MRKSYPLIAAACIGLSAGFAANADDKPATGYVASSDLAAVERGRTVQVDDGESVVVGNVALNANFPGKSVKATYLGVSASPAQPALQKQLQLKPGVGLVVDSVESGSPAEQAGVKEFDILHKIDDQILVNAEQLAVLVRTYEPKADVTITVIREGKPQQLKAKLAERDMMPLKVYFRDAVGMGGGEFGAVAFSRDPNVAHNFVDVPMERTVVSSHPFAARRAVSGDVRNGLIKLRSPGGNSMLRASSVSIKNDRHTLSVTTKDGRKHLVIKDKDDKAVFDGPITTKEEMDKIPADLRKTYDDILVEVSKDANNADGSPTTKPLETKEKKD